MENREFFDYLNISGVIPSIKNSVFIDSLINSDIKIKNYYNIHKKIWNDVNNDTSKWFKVFIEFAYYIVKRVDNQEEFEWFIGELEKIVVKYSNYIEHNPIVLKEYRDNVIDRVILKKMSGISNQSLLKSLKLIMNQGTINIHTNEKDKCTSYDVRKIIKNKNRIIVLRKDKSFEAIEYDSLVEAIKDNINDYEYIMAYSYTLSTIKVLKEVFSDEC